MRMILLAGIPGIFALTSCAINQSAPAEPGMSIQGYYDSCGVGEPIVETDEGITTMECIGKPSEYVIVQDGVVEKVMLPSEAISAMIMLYCDEADRACRSEVVNYIDERTARKRSLLASSVNAQSANRNQSIGRALQNLGASTSQAFSTAPINNSSNGASSAKTACFKTSEYTSGMNKVCNYDCLGSAAAITVGAVELCPISIDR